jgi:Domain of unknown function (DUF1905)
MELQFREKIWRWKGDAPAAWHFITLPEEAAGQIRFVMGKAKGFGSVRIKARIGGSSWKTSLFPDKKTKSYLLPVKADVRKAEGLIDGKLVAVTLELDV